MHTKLPTSLQGIIDVIERDFPGCEWLVSNCANHCGQHVAGIRQVQSIGHSIDLATGETRELGRVLWEANAHAAGPYHALVGCYAEALEKFDS
jgi:hypothetical protein